jgi:hypothetical protein
MKKHPILTLPTRILASLALLTLVAGCDSLPSVPLPDFSSEEPKGDPGIEVIAIEPGTEAARQGMLPGDVILEVNGDAIYNKETLVTAFSDTGRWLSSNRVIVRRGDRELRFQIRTNLDYSGIVTRSATGIMSPRDVK